MGTLLFRIIRCMIYLNRTETKCGFRIYPGQKQAKLNLTQSDLIQPNHLLLLLRYQEILLNTVFHWHDSLQISIKLE